VSFASGSQTRQRDISSAYKFANGGLEHRAHLHSRALLDALLERADHVSCGVAEPGGIPDESPPIGCTISPPLSMIVSRVTATLSTMT
jgi:hypothetical protein